MRGYVTQHKEATKHKQNLSKHRQPHKIKITLSDFGSLLYNTQDCLNDTCLAKLLESLCCTTDNELQQGIRSKTHKTMVVTFLIKEDTFVCLCVFSFALVVNIWWYPTKHWARVQFSGWFIFPVCKYICFWLHYLPSETISLCSCGRKWQILCMTRPTKIECPQSV